MKKSSVPLTEFEREKLRETLVFWPGSAYHTRVVFLYDRTKGAWFYQVISGGRTGRAEYNVRRSLGRDLDKALRAFNTVKDDLTSLSTMRLPPEEIRERMFTVYLATGRRQQEAPPPAPTVGEFAKFYIDSLRPRSGRSLSASSLDTYAVSLRAVARYVGEDLPLNDLRPSHLVAMQGALLEAGARATTPNIYIRQFRTAVRWALRSGALEDRFDVEDAYTWVARLMLVATLPKDASIRRPFTADELSRIFGELTHREQAARISTQRRAARQMKQLALLSLLTGARIGSIVNVRVGDITFDESGRPSEIYFAIAKGGKPYTQPLATDALRDVIAEALDDRFGAKARPLAAAGAARRYPPAGANPATMNRSDVGPLLWPAVGPEAGPDDVRPVSSVSVAFYNLLVALDVKTPGPGLCFHCLRHSFGTLARRQLQQEGLTDDEALLVVRDALNHGDVGMSRIYTVEAKPVELRQPERAVIAAGMVIDEILRSSVHT